MALEVIYVSECSCFSRAGGVALAFLAVPIDGAFAQQCLSLSGGVAETIDESVSGWLPGEVGVAVDKGPANNYLQVWSSVFGGPVGGVIHAQERTPNHTALTPVFNVNTSTSEDFGHVSVDSGIASRYTVVWAQDACAGAGALCTDIRARILFTGGTGANDFGVNTTPGYTDGNQIFPDVAVRPSDGYMFFVWEDQGTDADGDGSGVFGRLFTPSGSPRLGEVQLSREWRGNQELPRVSSWDDGDIAVVWAWKPITGPPAENEVKLRIWNENMSARTADINVGFVSDSDWEPDVATLGYNKLIVVWSTEKYGSLGSPRIAARVYDENGVALTEPFEANAPTSYTLGFPRVAHAPAVYGNDRWIVAWKNLGTHEFWKRAYDTGTPLASEDTVYMSGPAAFQNEHIGFDLADGCGAGLGSNGMYLWVEGATDPWTDPWDVRYHAAKW